MSVEMSTTVWMIGVIAFGVVFYVFATHHAKNSDATEDDE